MIRFFIGRQIDAFEKKMGASMDHLRHIMRVSLPDLFRLRKFSQLANRRTALPPAPFHVARLVAVMAEDCGDCVQVEVNLSKEDGLASDLIKAVVEMRPSDLPEELGDVYLFTECIIHNSGDVEPLRAKMRQRYGERGLVELAMAIAMARSFPTLKRGMGYATSCNIRSLKVA